MLPQSEDAVPLQCDDLIRCRIKLTRQALMACTGAHAALRCFLPAAFLISSLVERTSDLESGLNAARSEAHKHEGGASIRQSAPFHPTVCANKQFVLLPVIALRPDLPSCDRKR